MKISRTSRPSCQQKINEFFTPAAVSFTTVQVFEMLRQKQGELEIFHHKL
jgi:hypothetical protein